MAESEMHSNDSLHFDNIHLSDLLAMRLEFPRRCVRMGGTYDTIIQHTGNHNVIF